MKEVWKDIKGFEGKYQVSNLGRIKSLERKNKTILGEVVIKETILKPFGTSYKRKYMEVKLGGKNRKVHRLVAQAFIPNPNNYKEVNHKDENPSNNNINNLEWCDHKYNMNYGTIRGRRSKAMKGRKLTYEQIEKIRERNRANNPNSKKVKCIETQVIYKTILEASKEIGVSSSLICSHLKNCKRNKTAGGYHWQYV